MANKERGEASFEADGVSYTLRFDQNALCAIEYETAQPHADTLTKLIGKRYWASAARVTLWAGLKKHHPGITLDEAGDILKPENQAAALMAISAALTSAFAAPEKVNGSRPQKEVGTGIPS